MQLCQIRKPEDIKHLSRAELDALAGEIRAEIIGTVSRSGGHLSANLGVVELTLALHRAFDCPRDTLVFDVGHQCYAHKLLTGRYDRFRTLRQTDGISGFPRADESAYDAFSTGHASDSISLALGLARARDLKQEDNHIVAVVGDGALTGGMCFEALNDAGSSKTRLIVVLNDNQMSISRNVGAISQYLTHLRASKGWLNVKRVISGFLQHCPPMYRLFLRVKNHIRNVFVHDKLFSALGFRYYGPIDGHDVPGMERLFRRVKTLDEPVLIHVATQKGFGFEPAQKNPDAYHGVGAFDAQDGTPLERGRETMGQIACGELVQLAQNDERVCVVTAAMTDNAGMTGFAREFPSRLFDVGIAEEHAAAMAAGLCKGGMRPFVAIYDTFMQRAYDQLIEDIALQRLPVCLLMDRAGLGAADGETHHGVFGIAYLRHIPGLLVLMPRCGEELRQMVRFTLSQDKPVAIRYRRVQDAPGMPPYAPDSFVPGRWETLRRGTDAALLTCGNMTQTALAACDILAQQGISCAAVNASSVKPLDEAYLSSCALKLFTLEEAQQAGGFGGAVNEWCVENGRPQPLCNIALPDAFVTHGARETLLARLSLDAQGVARQIKERLNV